MLQVRRSGTYCQGHTHFREGTGVAEFVSKVLTGWVDCDKIVVTRAKILDSRLRGNEK